MKSWADFNNFDFRKTRRPEDQKITDFILIILFCINNGYAVVFLTINYRNCHQKQLQSNPVITTSVYATPRL
jgi:hypothetical protein